MPDTNPYESSFNHGAKKPWMRAPRSTARWVIIGFVLAAAIPKAFGAYGLCRESVYAASLPPGTAGCGNGALTALLTIVVAGPICGLVGGAVSWAASKIRL